MATTIHERISEIVLQLGGGKNTAIASKLGVSEGNIRGYIKGVMPKQDVLEKIVINLDVNPEWLLTGRGEMTKTSQPTPTEHIQTSCVSKNKDKEKFDGNQGLSPEIFDKLLSTIKEQQITIKEQAEEIGVLKQMIVQLKQDKSGHVSDASDSTVANAV